jgi:hypothetical protein
VPVPDPPASVVARYRVREMDRRGPWCYGIFNSRERFRWFLETWVADMDIEEIGMPDDPAVVFIYWS